MRTRGRQRAGQREECSAKHAGAESAWMETTRARRLPAGHSLPQLSRLFICRTAASRKGGDARLPGLSGRAGSPRPMWRPWQRKRLSLLVSFALATSGWRFDASCVIEVVETHRIHGVPHRTRSASIGSWRTSGANCNYAFRYTNYWGLTRSKRPESRRHDSASYRRAARATSRRGARAQNRWAFPVDEVEGIRRMCRLMR